MPFRKSLFAISFLFVLLLGLGSWMPAYAELTDHGPYGEYFHDSSTGLYWFDPGFNYGMYRGTLDIMSGGSAIWVWATSAQIDALVGQSSAAASDLEDVMGPRLTTIASGGPRWVGYYAQSSPDGWLIQSSNSPDFDTLTASSSQSGAASLGAGAWLVSIADPLTTTAVLEDWGDSGEYFHDTATGFYWCDPSTFHGMSRVEMENWLTANPGWRWASSAEVYDLSFKAASGGEDLGDIIGARLITIGGGGPRWVGLFDQTSEPTGILLEARTSPTFHLITGAGTQSSAVDLGCGAWIVREDDPTPVDSVNWGDVKSLFR